MTISEEKPTVFFDGACPLCQREMGFYRRQNGADAIEWIDISRCGPDQLAPGLSREAALKRFHIRRPDGSLASGAAAFAELWSRLPRFRAAGRAAGLPGVRHVLEGLYRLFLPIRPKLRLFFEREAQRSDGHTRE